LNKVLVTTGIFPPDIGGPATYVPKFASYLSNLGESVKVITLSSEKQSNRRPYSFSVIRLERRTYRPVRILLTIKEISKNLSGSDTLFCNGLMIETAVAVLITRFHGNSVVKVVGDPVWERMKNKESTQKFLSSSLKSLLWKALSIIERKVFVWSLGQFRHITCPGYALAETVKSWNENFNVQVITNGVDIAQRVRSGEKRFDLISISRLVPWKNLDQLIQIAVDLGCSLAIVGDGPSMVELKKLSKGSQKIVFLGKQDPRQVDKLLSESRVFCQISDYEGLSFSLLQAMAHALPCVVSDIPANRHVFETNPTAAIFFTKSTKKLVLEEMKRLLLSENRRTSLGLQAREIIENCFDEQKKLREMYELLSTNA